MSGQEIVVDGLPLPRLVGDNYSRWKIKMANALEAKSLEGIVLGSDNGPTAEDLEKIKQETTEANEAAIEGARTRVQLFKTRDAKARMLLTCCMDDKHLDIVEDCTTARQIWEKLRVEYADKSTSSYHQLLKEFYTMKMSPGQTVSEYIAKIDSIVSKLKDLKHPQDETAVIIRIIQGLSQEFEAVIRWWDMTPSNFQSKELLLMNLKKEEKRLMDSKPAGEALIAKFPQNGSKKKRYPKAKKQLECYICHEGHGWRNCPKRPEGYVPEQALKKYQDLKKDASQGRSDGDRHQKSVRKAIIAKAKSAKALGLQTQPDDESFFLDTGASYHYTGHFEWFSDYKPFDEGIPIEFGDKKCLNALGKGKIRAISTVGQDQFEIELQDVWYIPGICDNLFSWGAASRKGARLVSEGSNMSLMDDDGVFITGYMSAMNLWKLNLTVIRKANISKTSRTLEEWHEALGHPDVQQIKNMVKNRYAEGMEIVSHSGPQSCGECQSGKGHCASHPTSSQERAKDILDRVHVDLSGPIDPPSVSGYKYFMLIKDEYSGYHFVYFLYTKAHALDKIKRFINDAGVISQKKVKIIRSDQGTEFKNQGMSILSAQEGFIQEFSCSRTPQQNGFIERGNRTIDDTARTMLQSSNLDLSLWAEAVNTAVYLRNRMTNSVNKDRTPFEIFRGHKPNLSHAIPFGTELHIIDRSCRSSKFSPRTKEAYMVGYGPRVNTYRCLISGTKNVLETSDVVPARHRSKTREVLSSNRPMTTFMVDSLEAEEIAPSVWQPSLDESVETIDANEGEPDNVTAPTNDDEAAISASINLPETSEEISRAQCTLDPIVEESDRAATIPLFEPIKRRPVAVTTSTESRSGANASERENTIVYPSLSSLLEAYNQPAPPVPTRSASIPAPVTVPCSTMSELQRAATGSSNSTQQRRVHFPQRLAHAHASTSTSTDSAPVRVATKSNTGQQTSSLTSRVKGFVSTLSPKKRVVPTRNVKSVYARNLIAAARDVVASSSQPETLVEVECTLEPTTFAEAVNSPEQVQWIGAIEDELAAHKKNQTWAVVPRKEGISEVTAKWVFKRKQTATGRLDRYKARLVARGFDQQAGVDYKEVFSPVVRMDSIRMLFSLCAQYNWEYRQFDIATAFLNGELEEELYLKPPEGLDVPDGFTCRLKKSLYGLKQSPRCWNAKLVEKLKLFGMKPTLSDPCVFVKTDPEVLYLAVYVDDGLIFSDDSTLIEGLIRFLKKHFEVKIVDSACFLGIEIVQSKDRSSIFLHQKGYIQRVLQRFDLADCKGVATPLQVGHELNKPATLKAEAISGVPYKEAIGSLLYCAMGTRPDLAHALSVLSKYTQEPRQQHWIGVKRVMRYLKATLDHGLVYKPVETPRIVSFADSDFAGDQSCRRSVSGMITFINTGPVTFKSKQQNSVAQSTTEAEYVACTIGVKDLIWLLRFTEELNVPLTKEAWLMCDNQGAIKLVKNPEFHERTKHIDVRYHFIRELYEEGKFDIKYIQTERQRADIFTKALTAQRHNYLKQEIGCISLDCYEPGRVLEMIRSS